MINKIQSPFRYPGAKTQLLPVIMNRLRPKLDKADIFYDIFSGGASVLLKVAEEYPSMRIHINDKDPTIRAFWTIVTYSKDNQFENFMETIDNTVPTVDLFKQLRNNINNNLTIDDLALNAIFFNRTTFSGIAKAGPIGGFSQTSEYKIDCRWNADKIIKKCKVIRSKLRGRTTIGMDSFSDMLNVLPPGALMYLDPPYYHKGNSLYTHTMGVDDHKFLAQTLKRFNNWVLSYDDCPEIANLYNWAKITKIDTKYSISGVKTTWAKKLEFIIEP